MRHHSAYLLVILGLFGCQTDKSAEQLTISSKSEPATLIALIANSVQKCWFRSNDPTFRSYKLANEVTSLSGRPRLLLVPRNNPTGLPSLVIQAEKSGTTTKATTFGPLLSTGNGQRIVADVKRWAKGDKTCAA